MDQRNTGANAGTSNMSNTSRPGASGDGDSGIAGGLHETADTTRELAQTLERGADALDSASRAADKVSHKVDRVTDAASRAGDEITRRARERPMAAVAAAFTVGFVAGRMMG